MNSNFNISRDYYAELGLEFGASHEEIKAAFFALAKQHHPDKSGETDAVAFRRVREAYEKLTDASFRAEYDRAYRPNEPQADTPSAAGAAGDEGLGHSATAEEEQQQEGDRADSPPPTKPRRKFGESNAAYYLGRPYVMWKKRMYAWEARHPEMFEGGETYDASSSAAQGRQVGDFRLEHQLVPSGG
ncbi:hypothetical protein N0V83_008498 [Neocucurbitaria cava]|uniref:J domain-containing protein n=1 Tax=Neocucurbitaria cava TaxID=798079 RepID=A0A9W8Y285_9PLEO|nr:hypothetical protein N0V83_008498 [Neocucurbitaria cava]